MKLHNAFRVVKGDVVALVGAGGKTSTLVALSHELQALGWRVLVTTTTRIAEAELHLFPQKLIYRDSEILNDGLCREQCVFAYSEIRDGKAYGLPLAAIASVTAADVMLIEADGARRRLLKAPASHEPVIPPEATLVVTIASFASIGQPLDDATVYNAEAIAERFGARLNDPIRAEWLAAIVSDKTLGLKGVPESARAVAFINQTPPTKHADVQQIAALALENALLQGIAFGSAQAQDPVFGVVEPGEG